jgi:hypothetical protein
MAFCTEALALARTIGDMDTIVNALNAFATALYCKGAYAQARDVYQEGFVLSRAMDMQAWVVLFLEGLAAAELGCNNLTQATRFGEGLLAYVQSWRCLSGRVDSRLILPV